MPHYASQDLHLGFLAMIDHTSSRFLDEQPRQTGHLPTDSQEEAPCRGCEGGSQAWRWKTIVRAAVIHKPASAGISTRACLRRTAEGRSAINACTRI